MANWKETCALRVFGLKNIPLLFITSPTIIHLNDETCEVKISLNYWTRNHLKSMYFGVLAMGADCAGGLMAMSHIKKSGKKVALIFKDFKADFLKRAENDTHFICHDGKKIKKLVEQAIKTKQRVHMPCQVIAIVPKVSGDEPVAKFQLTLSLKATG